MRYHVFLYLYALTINLTSASNPTIDAGYQLWLNVENTLEIFQQFERHFGNSYTSHENVGGD